MNNLYLLETKDGSAIITAEHLLGLIELFNLAKKQYSITKLGNRKGDYNVNEL